MVINRRMFDFKNQVLVRKRRNSECCSKNYFHANAIATFWRVLILPIKLLSL